jgi:CRP/FNR family transcriptional regulator, cyclic AMP receptor protein
MEQNAHNSLAGVELLSELTADSLASLERRVRFRRYAAKELIFDLESGGTEVYFIVAGEVQVVNYSPSGREVSFARVPAGGYIGELSAIDGRPRSATIVAVEDTTLASISADAFQSMLLDYPHIAIDVLQRLSAMVRAGDERIMDLTTLSAINRVHTEILRMSTPDEDGDNTALISPIPTHSDIAAWASTTRETVSRVLSNLARVFILERDDKALRILDVVRLKDMIEAVD